MLGKMSVSICRSNGYLMIGMCLGLSLSLLLSPGEIEEYQLQQQIELQQKNGIESAWYPTSTGQGPVDEYIPKINMEGKPRRAQKVPKTIVRPRYYSTELGIRDKIFIGVLTSREHLHSRGIAINKTVAHLVDKIRYFITIPEKAKPNVTLPGIVGFTDTRNILKPFHVIKYITDNYLEEYDYYFIIKDSSYINARNLLDLINKISVSKDVHLGSILENSKDICSLEAGILLGNSLVRKLKTNLDWCVKNTFSIFDDINFGRCVYHSTEIPCSNSIDDKKFTSIQLSTSSLNPESVDLDFDDLMNHLNFENSISLHPILTHRNIYKIHAYFTLNEMKKIDKVVKKLSRRVVESSELHSNSTEQEIIWPIGNQKSNRALGRFDILRWNYFNETHIFMQTDFENTRKLIGSMRIEIDRAIEAAINEINEKYGNKLKFEKMENGWRKFDTSRGIDYIFDLNFINLDHGRKVSKRIQVCKLLGKAEILPVPYVTENSRINLILTIDLMKIDEAMEFMDQYSNICMEKKDKTSLMLVLLYDPDAPSKGTSDTFYQVKRRALTLTDKYKRDQSKITWLSIRLPTISTFINSDPMLQIAIADLVTKKFSPESLILFIGTKILLKPEFLNRVRMNTIGQWQLFSPIPFVEFHPDIAYANEEKNPEVDINRNNGRYDALNFESISFYIKDYQTVRKTSEHDIPLIRSDKDIQGILKLSERSLVDSIFQLFVLYSDLHPFRAVEPALKIQYSELDCRGSTLNEIATRNCEVRKCNHLGHRGQLAKLILEYENTHS